MAITPVSPPSNRIRSPFSIGSQPHYEIDPDIFGLLRNPRQWWENFQRQLVPVRARTLANRALIETNPRQAMLGFAQQIFGNPHTVAAQMGLISNLFTAAGVIAQNPFITGLGLLGSSTAHITAQEEATQRELLEQAIRQLVQAKNELEQTNQALQEEVTRLSQITNLLQEENRNLGQSVDRFTRHLERFERISTVVEAQLAGLNRAIDRHAHLPWHNTEDQLGTLKSSVASFHPSFLLFVSIFEGTQGPLEDHQKVIEEELKRIEELIGSHQKSQSMTHNPASKLLIAGLLEIVTREQEELQDTKEHLVSLAKTYEQDAETIEALKENWHALANRIEKIGLAQTDRFTPSANRELPL